MTRRAALPFLLALGGCTLIDQRTFDPEAGRAPPAARAPEPSAPPAPPSGPQPLVSIPLDPAVAWEEPLRNAVALALQRGRRDFEVRTVVPAAGTPDAQAAATEAAARVAAQVAAQVNRQNGRATLTAMADASRTGSAVLVFVR